MRNTQGNGRRKEEGYLLRCKYLVYKATPLKNDQNEDTAVVIIQGFSFRYTDHFHSSQRFRAANGPPSRYSRWTPSRDYWEYRLFKTSRHLRQTKYAEDGSGHLGIAQVPVTRSTLLAALHNDRHDSRRLQHSSENTGKECLARTIHWHLMSLALLWH